MRGQRPSLMHSFTSRGEKPGQLALLTRSLALFLSLSPTPPLQQTNRLPCRSWTVVLISAQSRGPWSALYMLPDVSAITHSPTQCALTPWESNSNLFRDLSTVLPPVGSFGKLQKVPEALFKPVYQPCSCGRLRTCKVTYSHCIHHDETVKPSHVG